MLYKLESFSFVSPKPVRQVIIMQRRRKRLKENAKKRKMKKKMKLLFFEEWKTIPSIFGIYTFVLFDNNQATFLDISFAFAWNGRSQAKYNLFISRSSKKVNPNEKQWITKSNLGPPEKWKEKQTSFLFRSTGTKLQYFEKERKRCESHWTSALFYSSNKMDLFLIQLLLQGPSLYPQRLRAR